MSLAVRIFLGALLAAWISAPSPARALDSGTSGICDRAALAAARDALVPRNVLLAITRLETGRGHNGRRMPWPWTINAAGKGYWFDTRAEAEAFAQRLIDSGRTSFDVGCFQINYRWHGSAFRSVQEMFEPRANARYAARFLQELYDEKNDWVRAVGAYHSRTPRHAQRYTDLYRRIHTDLQQELATNGALSPREFALLRPGAGASLASLVPLDAVPVSPFVEY